MKNCKKAIDNLEAAEFLLNRASKELLNYYSESTLSAGRDYVELNKADYNDCLKIARKLLLESYVD